MNAWWHDLSERERWIVGGGIGLLAALLLYALAWQPWQTRLKTLRRTVAAQREELAWMQQAAAEIKRLTDTASVALKPQGASTPPLLTLVDQTARAAGLGAAVKRVEPQGDRQVRVQLEQASFDAMIRWLNTLQQEHGVETTTAVIERRTDSDGINARLILQGITSSAT